MKAQHYFLKLDKQYFLISKTSPYDSKQNIKNAKILRTVYSFLVQILSDFILMKLNDKRRVTSSIFRFYTPYRRFSHQI